MATVPPARITVPRRSLRLRGEDMSCEGADDASSSELGGINDRKRRKGRDELLENTGARREGMVARKQSARSRGKPIVLEAPKTNLVEAPKGSFGSNHSSPTRRQRACPTDIEETIGVPELGLELALPEQIALEDGKGIKPGNLTSPEFYEIYRGIKEMRQQMDAPVDTMGAEMLGDREASIAVWRFQTLVSCMLSSQTKDEVTAACMVRLKGHGLTVQNILQTSDDKLRELLYGVSFHNNKAKYIKQTCKVLAEQYGDDIPPDFDSLVKLPGVGSKMANIVTSVAWGVVRGIAVDIHVHRICNRLGWVKTKTPVETEDALEKSLPRDLWSEFNVMLVGFGQQICRPVNPKCLQCQVQQLCPVGWKIRRAITY
eukprot:GHVS01069957.1.p1 GENE.GHVS01069957.1~~GHVS01069957.1.p1  ORF type:complete len:373 (-),score=34.40 GHVS01069957.1:259-1377(-)